MKATVKKGLHGAALFFFLAALSSSVFSQIDQTIYYQYCTAEPHKGCFVPVEGSLDSVGRDVATLGGSFRFCLALDTIDSGYAPIRVLLVLDKSGSMCEHYGPGRCCVVGDSSGMCSKNDPTNKRVDAANEFVDSLRKKSPLSQIGVLVYASSVSNVLNPVSLETDANVQDIHTMINRAGCSLASPPALPKTTTTLETNLGTALQRALSVIDQNYTTMPTTMNRHIILLTDGAWDDLATRSPLTLIQAYKTANPDRAVPVVHGVFISDSATHVQHGYPAQGCADDGDVDLSNLKTAADSTGGQFFGGTTPQTIVQSFQNLLDSMVTITAQQLKSLVVINTTNNDTAVNGAIKAVTNEVASWETTLDKLNLEMGRNNLTVIRTITRPGRSDTVITTHVTILRSDRYRESIDKDLYQTYCNLVQANIKITATPDTQPQNQPFNVKAVISGASNFRLDTTQIRIFTAFPDNQDGSFATFHLDGDLKNTSGPTAGTGTPTFSTTERLFGSQAIVSGSFTYSMPQLAGDFTLEEWVKPGTNGAFILLSGNGLEIGVTAGMRLYFKTQSLVDSSNIQLDDGVWSHIAVCRTGGRITLYINGELVSPPLDFNGTVPGGVVSILTPTKWVIDEIRFSNVSRTATEGGRTILTVPTLVNTAWTLKGTPSSATVLTVTPGTWVDGKTLDLTFAGNVAGRVLVNIRQKQTGGPGTGWSKNSNPVTIISDIIGPFVKRAVMTPGGIDSRQDTLYIQLSEPTNCEAIKSTGDPARSFIVSRGTDDMGQLLSGSEFLQKGCTSPFITELTLLVPVGIDPDKDSLRLTNIKAVDTIGNPPITNKKGDIEWGDGSKTIVTPILTDPEKMANIKARLGIQDKENMGKIVNIQTVRDFAVVMVNGRPAYGTAQVYDAVGNLVAEQATIDKAAFRPRTYYIYWNGLNRQGRKVAPGTYLIRYQYTLLNETKVWKDQTKVYLPGKTW
jgi:hypothetical protein